MKGAQPPAYADQSYPPSRGCALPHPGGRRWFPDNLRIDRKKAQLSPGHSSGRKKGSRFDPVGNAGVLGSMKAGGRLDDDAAVPRPGSFRPWPEAVLQVDNLWAPGRRFQSSSSPLPACRQDGVFRRPHAGIGKADMRAPRSASVRQ